jgi:hypothetical protein
MPNNPTIIDVSYACGSQAAYFAGAGVKTVIRYYSRDTGMPEKRLSLQEAQAFAAAGVRLAIVHEARFGNQIASFTESLGQLDAAYARQYGAKIIGQPEGSAIYFGVDVDAMPNEIQDNVIPYFKGVAAALTAANGLPLYQVGVYGSGATCEALLAGELAQFTWLAQSKGWSDYQKFLQSNKWSLLQEMPASVGEIECDPDQANGNFGDFFLPDAATASAGGVIVIARAGLRLRSGPGTDFDVLKVVPYGTQVHPLKTSGDWTMVSLTGDAASDGFVNSHFLSA